MDQHSCRVVLSETAHLLDLFKRSSLWNANDAAEEDPIVQNFRILQQTVRKARIGGEMVPPLDLVFPFCEALRASYLSAPYKNAALVAINNFLVSKIFTPDSQQSVERMEDAITEIVDALVNCRFVQTDKVQDQLIHFRLIQLIQAMISSGAGFGLADEPLWNVVEHCYHIALHPNENETTRTLAETTLYQCVGFVYAHIRTTNRPFAPRFGAPGAVKVFGFFCSKLQSYAKRSVTSSVQTQLQVARLSRSKSSVGNGLNEEGHLRPLLLSMKTLLAAIEAGREDILFCRPLFDLVRDDLGETVVLLTSFGYPAQVLRLCLDIFLLCFDLYMPVLLQLTQVFFLYVYLRSLHQLSDHLKKLEELQNGAELVLRADGIGISHHAFTLEELEIVVGSLIDLLSSPHVVPTLFVNFDCHPARPSIIEPMLEYVTSSPSILVDHFCLCILQLTMQPLLHRCTSRSLTKSTGTSGSVALVDQCAHNIHSKNLWKQGAALFITRPREGLLFLQDKGLLQTPLDTDEVAKFLRTCPYLTKESVGEYLGALGADLSKLPNTYIGDSEDFHRAALRAYCKLFPFKNQPMLLCLRIFLSAFLLPKEAQQIDRILLAFAEYAHRTCLEGVTAVFESEDVTYLFTVSIIMLNTDLHNANIRADRRMKIEQFVRNNQNYGVDYHQTRSVPAEYLEAVYKSIQECPIKTEGLDRSTGVFTEEEWSDVQLQVKQGSLNDMVIVFHLEQDVLNQVFAEFWMRGVEFEEGGDVDTVAAQSVSSPQNHSADLYLQEHHLDTLLLESVWRFFFNAVSEGLMVEHTLQPDSSTEETARELETLPYFDHSVEIILWLLKVAAHYHLHHIVDSVVFLLCEVAGLEPTLSEELLTRSPASLSESLASSSLRSPFLVPTNGTASHQTWEYLAKYTGARIALITVFQIAHKHAGEVREGWLAICCLIARMRDMHILPRRVLMESETDILPMAVQEEFEEQLYEEQFPCRTPPVVASGTASPTKFSLQGITEMMFGTAQPNTPPRSPSPELLIDREALGRWDAGPFNFQMTEDPFLWDGAQRSSSTDVRSRDDADPAGRRPNESASTMVRLYEPQPEDVEVESSPSTLNLTSVHIRLSNLSLEHEGDQALAIIADLIVKCRIGELLTESKFMSNDSLLWFLRAMMLFSHANDFVHMSEQYDSPSQESGQQAVCNAALEVLKSIRLAEGSQSEDHIRNATTAMEAKFESPSLSSSALFEVLVAETLLRNRDRLQIFWPLVQAHYTHAFITVHKTSYLFERRVVGILRLLTRLGSRDGLVGRVLELIEPFAHTRPELISEHSLALVAPHIATGLWRFVTLNVSVLPQLQDAQWESIFSITSTAAKVGGFASVKVFEMMVVLLHEPQLRASIPGTCVQVVEALVGSPQIPKDVVLGSLRLLQHLHSRMSVLGGGNDTLWQSCWLPILEAIAKGMKDFRSEVQRTGVKILMACVIDDQANNAPAEIILGALTDVMASTCAVLTENICQILSERNDSSSAGASEENSHKLSSIINPALEALSALCRGVLAHLPRIINLSLFNQLWSQLLYIFGLFLGAPESPTLSSSSSYLSLEWLQARETAMELLKNLLLVVVASGVFVEQEDTNSPGLWALTFNSVEKFQACPDLLTVLFPSCSLTKPPTAQDIVQAEPELEAATGTEAAVEETEVNHEASLSQQDMIAIVDESPSISQLTV